MGNEDVTLLICYLALIVCAIISVGMLCYYFIRCSILERENLAFRRFIKMQYHMDADYLESVCALIEEATAAQEVFKKGQK